MRCLVLLATANALQQRYFASTARGCEPYLADELASLGASHVEIGRSGVHFDGDTRVGYAALIQCRTATKVLEVLAWRNGVETAADLYNLGRDVPWPELMDVEGTLRVDATLTGGVSQALAHSHFSSLTLKNAVVDSFRGENQLGRRPSVAKDDCDVPLHLFLDRDRCTLYRSLSSESLHKRGYRARTSHRAALRPTVAAAMLYGARWPQRSMRGEALCDPMCGSGTFLIEAALMARQIAPGLQRAESEGFACGEGTDGAWDEVVRDAGSASWHALQNHGRGRARRRRVSQRWYRERRRRGRRDDEAAVRVDAGKPSLVISNPPWDAPVAPTRPGRLCEFPQEEAGGGVAIC